MSLQRKRGKVSTLLKEKISNHTAFPFLSLGRHWMINLRNQIKEETSLNYEVTKLVSSHTHQNLYFPVSTCPGRVSILRTINLLQWCSHYSKHFWNSYFVIPSKPNYNTKIQTTKFLRNNKFIILVLLYLFHLLKEKQKALFCRTIPFIFHV